VETYGLSGDVRKFWNLPADLIFSVEGSVNVVDAWGSGTTPIFERVFLGGANNLRGFDYRDVGPKDEFGEPLGGRTSAYATLELTWPMDRILPFLPPEKVRGVVFYDIGMVSEDFFDFGGDTNANVGLGLHVFLPVGPVKVEFGIPTQSDAFNDSGGKFNFNIGYSF
jgi:outer membrane protein insertion porin family